MLSKKHYNAFARILGRAKTREEAIEELIEFFKADNPNFKEEVFRKAIEAQDK